MNEDRIEELDYVGCMFVRNCRDDALAAQMAYIADASL